MEFGRNLTATNMRFTFWLKNKRLAGGGADYGGMGHYLKTPGYREAACSSQIRVSFCPIPLGGRASVAGRHTCRLHVHRD